MIDFPAAHSMDTDWFAIDNDGNIGVFDSGEGGAVPDLFALENTTFDLFITDIYDFIRELAKYTQGVVRVNADGKTFADGTNLKYFEGKNSEIWDNLLLVLASEDVIEKLKSQNSTILRFSGEPLIIYVEKCGDRTIQNLLKSGEILGGKDFELQEYPSVLGLFYYSHPAANVIAYP